MKGKLQGNESFGLVNISLEGAGYMWFSRERANIA